MQELFAQIVASSLSPERLGAYRRYSGDTEFDSLLRYMWNTELGASFYGPLQHLEVTMRNAMHIALVEKYGTELWFDIPQLLKTYQTKQVDKARSKLAQSDQINPGKIIAELEFGFWTGLLSRKYAPSIVPVVIKGAFSGVERRYRERSYLCDELNAIRSFRNRVFHHEPIWYLTDLSKKHAMVMQFLLWLSPSVFRMAVAVDRFASVYAQGTLPFRNCLMEIARTPRMF